MVIRLLISIFFLIGLDQWVKYMAVQNLMQAPLTIIDNVFELTYVENRGAAFGMLQNKLYIFIPLTLVVLAAIIYYYVKLPRDRKYIPLRISFILFIAGAIGNLIDRIRLGYVVDMFYFKLIDFPVFNMADSYVVIGAILLIILMLFIYKDDDLIRKNKELSHE